MSDILDDVLNLVRQEQCKAERKRPVLYMDKRDERALARKLRKAMGLPRGAVKSISAVANFPIRYHNYGRGLVFVGEDKT